MKPTHLLAATLLTALIITCLAAPAAALSGSGTASNPYIITTPAEFLEIESDLDAYYRLDADITFTSTTQPKIGSSSAPFTGYFDGNGHIITTQQSLFEYVSGGFYIHDLGLSISSKGNLILRSTGIVTGTVERVYATSSSPIASSLDFGSSNSYYSGALIGVMQLPSGSNFIIRDCWVDIDYNFPTGSTFPRGVAPVAAILQQASSSSDAYITVENIYSLGTINNPSSSSSTKSAGVISNVDGYTISSNYQIKNVVSLLESITANSGSRARVYVTPSAQLSATNIYANADMVINGNTISSSSNNGDGQSVSASTYNTISFWRDTLGWDFANTWYWDDDVNLPKLQVFRASIPPTITSISASPATGGQQTTYTLSVSATTEAEGGIASYQWAYSTNGGTSWQAISGATTATYQWTPGQSVSGTVHIKTTVTGADGGEVDSYDAGYTDIKITVITPPAISSISTSRPLQKVNTPTTLTAIFADTQTSTTYQWYYSTNSGTSWQAISGATTATAEWTPTVTGTLSIKIIASNQYGESSELSTTLKVLPTYTPDTIAETTPDISISAENKYQATQQFTLTTDLYGIEYYTPNLAYLAQGNALYYIDSAEKEVIPVSNTTGNTISSAYIGQNTGIITDTSGNTAVYTYAQNNWQYIEQKSASIIASTTEYAATITNGQLTIYNTNGNQIAQTATTLTNLNGNDNTNVFAGYSGKTITYYWVQNGQIQTASQTITQTIANLHQIPNTENWIVSTDSNTLIIGITNTGTYSLIASSDTTDPLIHTQATSINVVIGVSAPNEIYVIGADGETDGTYVTGATLNDASISKATGLYAITGGEDRQAYILAKSTSSTWQLAQVVSFGDVVDFAQISTTGTYAAVTTGLKLYLLEAMDISVGTYMLQGVVIGSSGQPYGGKMISINGDQIRTDTTGKFLYPVQPNTLYTITAGDTTIEYTATNAALQQIAIRVKPSLMATDVTYSAEYNAESQAILMSYNDAAGKTTDIIWKVYETANNTLVGTYTGNTASFPVAAGNVYQNYYVQLSADRGAATVTNTWSITPAGGQPVDLFGLDEDGRNIIFGFLLLILAGLFGVMHSRSGAIIVALGACVLRYLELITIPWLLITIAAVFAIVAAIAHGGLNR